jgi:hypothetical protein
MLLGVDGVAFPIIFGVNNYAIFLPLIWIDRYLSFCVRINADIENSAVSGKPGVGPAAVIADSNGRDTVDNAERFSRID